MVSRNWVLNLLDPGGVDVTAWKNLAQWQMTGMCHHGKIWLRARVTECFVMRMVGEEISCHECLKLSYTAPPHPMSTVVGGGGIGDRDWGPMLGISLTSASALGSTNFVPFLKQFCTFPFLFLLFSNTCPFPKMWEACLRNKKLALVQSLNGLSESWAQYSHLVM